MVPICLTLLSDFSIGSENLGEEEVLFKDLLALQQCGTKETTVNSGRDQIHWQIPEIGKDQITKTKFVYPTEEAGFYATRRQRPLEHFQSKVT